MNNVIIVDTNLIFSSLLPSASVIRDLLLEKRFDFYAPNYIITELFRHKEKMLRYSKLEEGDFYGFFNGITENIKFIPLDFISLKSRQEAYNLCYDIDIKDTLFVALAIELNALLWTGDKKLKAGLKRKGFDHFFDSSTLLDKDV